MKLKRATLFSRIVIELLDAFLKEVGTAAVSVAESRAIGLLGPSCPMAVFCLLLCTFCGCQHFCWMSQSESPSLESRKTDLLADMERRKQKRNKEKVNKGQIKLYKETQM